MTGKVKKEYEIKCNRKELEALHEAIIVAMKNTKECNPFMDIFDTLKEDIGYLLTR